MKPSHPKQDIRKTRSSLLKHIFSTIPAMRYLQPKTEFTASSVAQEGMPKKYTFALRAPFPVFSEVSSSSKALELRLALIIHEMIP
jgi:hypothetical protein